MPILPRMPETPAFLDSGRPPVPDLVEPRAVLPFFLPQRPVRGRLVRLGPLADALLSRHDNHPVVTKLVGQALALAAGLSSALKFRGSFSLQAKGDGPISMLLADCTDAGELRGHALTKPAKLETLLERDAAPTAEALLGTGYLAFTVDQGDEQNRHQGIVSIQGGTLAEMALHYFDTSEQLLCQVRLACERTSSGLAGRSVDPGEGCWRGRHRSGPERRGSVGKLAHRHYSRRDADRRRVVGRRPAARAAAVSAISYRGGGRRSRSGAVVRLPLFARTPGQYSAGVPGGRPGPYGGR